MPDPTFQILVSQPDSIDDEQLTVGDYLAACRQETLDEPPVADSATLSATVDGVEQLEHLGPLGGLSLLTRQLRDAADRLRTGQAAIVRAPDMSTPKAPYFLFEPHPVEAPETVSMSIFAIEDEARKSWFPIAGFGVDDPEKLFAYVRAHRDELIAAGRSFAGSTDKNSVFGYQFDDLLEAIDRGASDAEELLAIYPESGPFA